MNYSLGPRVNPRVVPKVGPSQVRVDPNVEESQLWCTVYGSRNWLLRRYRKCSVTPVYIPRVYSE